MPNLPCRVLLLGSSHRIGLTALMVEMALALNAEREANLLVVSGETEQFPGLFATLQSQGVASAQIEGLDEHRRFWQLTGKVTALIDDFQPQVVHVQTNWQLALASAARRRTRTRFAIVSTVHGYRHNDRAKSFVARLIMCVALRVLADKVLLPSTFLATKFRCLGRKRALLFLGIDEAFFSDAEPIAPGTHFRLVYAAQFRHGKNQELLIRACAKLRELGHEDWELLLPGEGERLQRCKDLVQTLGLDEKVKLPGRLNRHEMLQTYLSCQVALVPTNVETFGLCIAEPFVLGRIVVSRRVGVAEDVISHGQNGFLFESESDLVRVLLNLLQEDRTKWLAVSRKALEDREVFRWSRIAEDYRHILDGVIENRR